MRTAPGHHLKIEVINQLAPNPPATAPAGVDPMNNPHRFNSTNLHVHGLQVVPHIFNPVGTLNANAEMISIDPGRSFTYDFHLPEDHPSGFYWYHPHLHGSTEVQVAGGMAGGIIVEGPIDAVPEIAAARDEFLVMQLLRVNQVGNTGLWDFEPIAYVPPSQGGYAVPGTAILTVNGQATQLINYFGISISSTTWNAQTPPTYQMQPGEVIRLRILCGLDDFMVPLMLPGFQVYLIAMDGISLLAPELQTGNTNLTALRLGPGNRAELLIKAPDQPTTSSLISLAQSESFYSSPQYAIANFVVSGPAKPMAIPTSLPKPVREYPLISDDEIVTRRSFTFGVIQDPAILATPGRGFTINGIVYDMSRVYANPQVGTAEEWTFSNTNNFQGHAFHIHTNSFEVHGLSFDPSYRRIQDTIWIPPSGSVTMRMRFKTWEGKDVFHCHILDHEDQGMMANTVLSHNPSAYPVTPITAADLRGQLTTCRTFASSIGAESK